MRHFKWNTLYLGCREREQQVPRRGRPSLARFLLCRRRLAWRNSAEFESLVVFQAHNTTDRRRPSPYPSTHSGAPRSKAASQEEAATGTRRGLDDNVLHQRRFCSHYDGCSAAGWLFPPFLLPLFRSLPPSRPTKKISFSKYQVPSTKFQPSKQVTSQPTAAEQRGFQDFRTDVRGNQLRIHRKCRRAVDMSLFETHTHTHTVYSAQCVHSMCLCTVSMYNCTAYNTVLMHVCLLLSFFLSLSLSLPRHSDGCWKGEMRRLISFFLSLSLSLLCACPNTE